MSSLHRRRREKKERNKKMKNETQSSEKTRKAKQRTLPEEEKGKPLGVSKEANPQRMLIV